MFLFSQFFSVVLGWRFLRRVVIAWRKFQNWEILLSFPDLDFWYDDLAQRIFFLFLLSGTKKGISLERKKLANPTHFLVWLSHWVFLTLQPRRADLDMNQHVNNVTYIGWVLEVVRLSLYLIENLKYFLFTFFFEWFLSVQFSLFTTFWVWVINLFTSLTSFRAYFIQINF